MNKLLLELRFLNRVLSDGIGILAMRMKDLE